MRPRRPSGFHNIPRDHAADHAFAQLAANILRGDLKAGDSLPPERILAEQFGTSRVIARQAVHRLADMGLVRVRQGGTTIVLDSKEANDPRVLQLFYQYADLQPRDLRMLTERQLLGAVSVLTLASRRATPEELAELGDLVDEWRKDAAAERLFHAFEERFWVHVARLSGNWIFLLEVSWWFQFLRERPELHRPKIGSLDAREHFYRELVRRLVARDKPAPYYLDQIAVVLSLYESGQDLTEETGS
jgi:DNA-binding FadR family transcriptional regulator